MRKLLIAALCCSLSSAAWAGSGTVNYTSSGGSPFRTTTDGSSNNIGQQTIWDATAGANGLTIGADHALLSDVGQGASVTMQSAATGSGNGTTLTVSNYSMVLLNVNCSVNCSGGTTINFEGTDSTGTYFFIGAIPVTGASGMVTSVVNQTGAAQFWVPVAGLTTIRARISAYSAGTITVTGTPISASNANVTQIGNATTPLALNQAGLSAATTGSPVLAAAAAYNGSTLDTLQDDANKNLKVATQLATSGGLTTLFFQPAASDNHTNLKNGAGQVYWVLAENNSATVNYLRFYNAASGFNGCNSATNLVTQIQIPANTAVGGINIQLPYGIPFSTGISYCVTSGYATNDTTNATATAMSITIGYN